ncbi:hypothetical protein Tco_1031440 [Tanacetum coccineum]|uniref:Uncharacterized protein n=1 Tax=Tanacetum coccineum TaxID=301880 RepID=A0ABQ5GAQ5_9ASTR
MEFQKDEMVVEPVAVVVSNIDDQIISAFMELDPVFNPADVDADIEPWDPYFTVDSFASITNPHAYYNMDKVRVDFVWFDQNANKFYYFLHDKHGEKNGGGVGYVDPTQYPRYQNYSFVRRDWLITVNYNTVITENPFAEETGFQMHIWLPSIRSFVEDKTHRKMLIDTIGRVIRGGLKQPKGVNTCEIWLRDLA